jgi:hypothetical protein
MSAIRIFTTLVNNKALAQYVRRLTIAPTPRPHHELIPVTKILPLFENLRIVTCTENLDILAGAKIICQDMLAITITDDFTRLPKPIGAFNGVHTISIDCPHISSVADFGEAYLLLPKLANLVIIESSQSVVRFITRSWDMPRLRNISISYCRYPSGYRSPEELLLNYRMVLQRVEVCNTTFGLTSRILDMPKLQELAFICPAIEVMAKWLRVVRAPALQRLIIHLNLHNEYRDSYIQIMFADQITEALDRFPVLKRIILVACDEPSPYSEDDWMRGIIGWCRRGLTVEIRANDEGMRRVYTIETILAYPGVKEGS